MTSLLLHMCCAHCGAYTVQHWRLLGHTVTVYWYNPNIHPRKEYLHRLEAVRRLTANMEVPLIESPAYNVSTYFSAILNREGERCRRCFSLRLNQTARTAAAYNYETFSSTLLISPWQQHWIVREAGETASRETSVPFLYFDLRKRYSDSRRITKPLDLYRQHYCGCMYSKWERFRNVGTVAPQTV